MATETSALRWDIETKCRWCGGAFVKLEIDRVRAWVCETEACRERQIQWKRVDLAGQLFYLPMPVQVEFHEAVQSQQFGAICIGGERGSSKSIALRNVIYNACETFPEFSVLFFRKELTELELNQWRFFERECPRIGADWNAKKIVFPKTGAEIRPAHSNKPDDYRKYIGADVDLIAIEQVEEFAQRQVAEIGASTGRNTRYDTWRGLLAVTENPGGPLSDFVNQIFVRKDLDRQKYPDYKPEDYHFIEARLSDNPWTDARYEQKLAILTPARRAMMRHGRRDVFEGQFFDDFLKDTHVTPTRPTAATWIRAMRFGYHDPGCVLWLAVTPSNHFVIASTLPLEKLNEDAAALQIAARDRELGVRPSHTIASKDLFTTPTKTGLVGESIADTFGRHGCPLIDGDSDELNGWQRCHAVLRPSPDGSPWLTVHDSCADLIAGLQQAMSDDAALDLIAPETPHLSALQALRLAVMSRPRYVAPRGMSRIPPGSPADVMRKLRQGSGRQFGRVA